MPMNNIDAVIRPAEKRDIESLDELEKQSFKNDRLSRKRLAHWISAENSIFLVVTMDHKIIAYGLVILRSGTRLARLYSIAVADSGRGLGIGKSLLDALEQEAIAKKRFFMRLEVAANNTAAINMYTTMGYKSFGVYADYYQDHVDAIRMQKPIRKKSLTSALPLYPWYRQTTDFTCGPSALLMAMHKLDANQALDQHHELNLWRQATSIYMTSGHGGCHPFGLALAAAERGFEVQLMLSQQRKLFQDGVRSIHKKVIMQVVEDDFIQQMTDTNIKVTDNLPSLEDIRDYIQQGHSVIGLISTYQLTGYKTPHWVSITHVDEQCFYIHDPDAESSTVNPLEFQHIPIANEDFTKMSEYGRRKLRAFIILKAGA